MRQKRLANIVAGGLLLGAFGIGGAGIGFLAKEARRIDPRPCPETVILPRPPISVKTVRVRPGKAPAVRVGKAWELMDGHSPVQVFSGPSRMDGTRLKPIE